MDKNKGHFFERHPKLYMVYSCLWLGVVVLKLLGIDPVTEWSWWGIMAPVWIPVVIAISLMMFAYVIVEMQRKNAIKDFEARTGIKWKDRFKYDGGQRTSTRWTEYVSKMRGKYN